MILYTICIVWRLPYEIITYVAFVVGADVIAVLENLIRFIPYGGNDLC